MNKVYRVIWSRTKNCYVIVSEIARKNQRGSSKGRGVIAALAMTSVLFSGIGTTTYAAYDPVTNTDTLTNQMVSETRGDTGKGDFKSYDHPDRNLVINWTDDSRGDGAAIRDAQVNAKNITINTDFEGNQWTDKGVISDGDTQIQAGGNIRIDSHDDGVYTEGHGSVTIEDFKNLEIRSTSGYGMVDNGGGIVVLGGEGSTVKISSEDDGSDFFRRPAIGNSMMSMFNPIGNGIAIKADAITLEGQDSAILAGPGAGGNRFNVNLAAKKVDIKGTVTGVGGDIDINPNIGGDVTITAPGMGASISAGTSPQGEGTHVTINKNAKGTVKILGEIQARGQGTTVLANLTGDGSFIDTKADDFGGGVFTKDAIGVSDGAKVDLSVNGNDSFVRGDTAVSDKGTLVIHATGERFALKRSYEDGIGADSNLLKAESEGLAKISITGNDSKVEGQVKAETKGNIQLDMTGKNMNFKGDLKTSWDDPSHASETDNASIQANFSGDNASMTGNVNAYTSESTITVNLSGANGSLTGNAESVGNMISSSSTTDPTWREKIYAGNTVNLNLTGAHAKQVGDLKAQGENTLNAVYSGKESSLSGNVENAGTMNLSFTNQSVMNGNMSNGEKTYEDVHHQPIKTVEGKLTATFDEGSAWKGDLETTAGSADIALRGGSRWTGNLDDRAADGAAHIELDGKSLWEGKASGNGSISLAGNSLWQLTGNSTAHAVYLDQGSTVSLEGTAGKLETEWLGGSGGMVKMDLRYLGDDVETYRGGNRSDFVVAHDGNGSRYTLEMSDRSSVNGMMDESKLYFASTAPERASFTQNEQVQVKNYERIYNKNLVIQKESDTGNPAYDGYDRWFLTPDSSSGENGNAINPNGTVPGTAYHTALALWRDDDTLLKRLGELRYNQADEGVWARFIHKGMERSGQHGFKGTYRTVQVGLDKKVETDQAGSWIYGGAISHMWGDTGYTEGHGEQKSTALSLYGTNIRPHGHYLDLVARVGRIDSDYETSYGDHGKFENWGSSISAEYGRKKVLGQHWTIEPQAQLTYSYLWGDEYTTRNGAKVHQDNGNSLIGRLGFVISHEFQEQTKHPGRVYLKASINHDFLGRTESSIRDDVRFTDRDDLGDTWYVVGLGTNIQLADTSQFYLDAERNFKADVKTKYQFNAGFRFKF